MSDLPLFVLSRNFDAPRNLVWQAWTDPKLLATWYGPNITTIIHKFDLQPDGVWYNEMQMGEKSSFQKVIFQNIIEQEKIVWHHHSSVDADWNDAPNPMMGNWPRVLLTTITFDDNGDKTNVRLTQTPHDANDEEIAAFAQMMEGMKGGWGKGYEIMDGLLAELKTS